MNGNGSVGAEIAGSAHDGGATVELADNPIASRKLSHPYSDIVL